MLLKKIKALFFVVFTLLTVTACANTSATKELHVGAMESPVLLSEYPLFNASYAQYSVPNQDAKYVKSLSEDIVIDVYFGTWCHDSQREVPRLLKALAHNDKVTVNLIALDYQKQDPNGQAQQAGIKYTPTMIVKKNGLEVGRIVERPSAQTLVEDIATFIQ